MTPSKIYRFKISSRIIQEFETVNQGLESFFTGSAVVQNAIFTASAGVLQRQARRCRTRLTSSKISVIIPRMDTFSKEKRHDVMSRIKSRDTSIEKRIRSALHRSGFRFRVCDRRYPGSPDLVLPRYFAVVFVNGCFWHAHENCGFYRMPKTNVRFWQKKFNRNRERDAEVRKKYSDICWRVCTVWECAIRGKDSRRRIENAVEKIIQWLDESVEPELEIRG